jgi:excisionase family DNA binding protein
MTSTTRVHDAVVQPDPSEERDLSRLRDQIDASFARGYTPCLIGPDGSQMELPASVFQALAFVTRGMAAGKTITLIPSGKQLTTQQAADMLHVSRPHLIKLLDQGEIPFDRVGSHRRVFVEDVVRYRDRRARVRREQLRELTRLSQATGKYD